jgi:hypothetical protein
LTEFDGVRCLLSWSGTMFEYLMPNLFMESYSNTLMDQSCRLAIEEQIRYGTEHNVPWGTSEAAYYGFDAVQVYQYKAFGIPTLGYKRGLSEDLVVAPYASMLALPFMPQAVMQNLARLENLKMWGTYGFYESADFTQDRLKTGEEHAIVRSFMVHHQGMSLLSICNYLYRKRRIVITGTNTDSRANRASPSSANGFDPQCLQNHLPRPVARLANSTTYESPLFVKRKI